MSTDEPLRFNAVSLLERLSQWKESESLALLRQGLAAFKAELALAVSSCPADASDGASVELGRRYLERELDQIAAALTLERARYYLERLIRAISEVRTGAINDINLNRWKEYEDLLTDSLWLIDRRDDSGAHTAGYWGNFIPQIPNQMMRRYTKKGDWVLDTFAGSGTTLIEGQRLGRNTLGIELQARMVAYAKGLIEVEPNPHKVVRDVVQGNSATLDYHELLARYGQRSVQLVIMHPPYFDIIPFSDDPDDLSNAASVDHFLTLMGTIAERAGEVLDRGRYLVVVIGDKYTRGEWVPLGFQVMNAILDKGFALKSIIVKNFETTTAKREQKELWRYRALVGGFYIFKHEYILLFKKR
ncbi:DNA methyltransferase [Candidatus Chloroploca asiatica]|uniref:Methyltransferase n=1 Tax=Candidatus Chloroploca asiatica TaxID=1506545 RepID=A0A2H3KTH3_9CHLR|nr:DNA methyltransferase [Candidatus Chloroploca asiatica]